MTLSILLWAPGLPEILVILVAVVFLFGGKKIPELMRGLGTGIREFNDAKDKVKSEINEGMKKPSNPAVNKTKEHSTEEAE